MTSSATLVEPAFCTHPPYGRTLGPEVADLGTLAGFIPDSEQRLALDLIFAMRPDNKPAALEVGICAGRQNLKTGVKKLAALGKLFILEQRLVVWSAHEFSTAQEAFVDMTELIENCPDLDREVDAIHRGHGDESIELSGRRRLKFKARTKAGGRGLSGDTVVLDEAMFLSPLHMGTLFPTLSARPEPQVLYGGSAGLAESAVWRAVRDRGRAGGDPRLAWLEWSDDLPGGCATPRCTHALGSLGCRLDDEARWWRASTTLGKRITLDYVRAERRALPPEEFARERLGWWDEPDTSVAIPLSAWLGRIGAEGRPDRPVAFALSAAWPDAEMGSVAVAGQRGSELYVQVVEHRRGTSWMAERVRELRDQWRPCAVMLDDKDPAAREKPALEVAGVELTPLSAVEAGQAFGLLHAEVMGDHPTLRHYDQPELNAAVAEAQVRPVGDAQTWARRGSVDISPLVAVTHAVYGLATKGQSGRFFFARR